MASWKETTWNMAWNAAEDYYDHGIHKFPGDKNRFRGMGRDAAVTALAEEAVKKLRETVPENGFGDETLSKLDEMEAGAVRKFLFEVGENPFTSTRNGDFERDVVDKWYGWGSKEFEAQMYRFGYDPNRPDDRQKFLAEIGEYQKAHDRAKLVKETVDDAGLLTKLAFSTVPATTKEAIRQSLTGDFDDSKRFRALGADMMANTAMAVLPSFNALSSPIAAGLSAAGAETARQLIQPTEGSVSDVVLSGMTAGTVPGIGQYLQGTLSRGASTGAKTIGRAFARGMRGAEDPLLQERNALKALLVKARKQADAAEEAASVSSGSPTGLRATLNGLAEAENWSQAERKLNALGYTSAERLNQLSRAQGDDALNALAEFENNRVYNEALLSLVNTVDDVPVERVIGNDPSLVKGGPVRITLTYKDPKGIGEALRMYDTPPVFYGANENIPQLTSKSVSAYAHMRDMYRDAFPQAYAEFMLSGKGAGKSAKTALAAGRLVGGIGGRIEPTVGSLSTILTGGDVGEKVTRFRETAWYRNLPQEKKNAIEKVLKGE